MDGLIPQMLPQQQPMGQNINQPGSSSDQILQAYLQGAIKGAKNTGEQHAINMGPAFAEHLINQLLSGQSAQQVTSQGTNQGGGLIGQLVGTQATSTQPSVPPPQQPNVAPMGAGNNPMGNVPPTPPPSSGGNATTSPQSNANPTIQNSPSSGTNSSNKPEQTEKRKGGDLAAALVGLGAGLQGQNVGEALRSLKIARGEEPIQPKETREMDIRSYSAQLGLANDQYTRLLGQITTNNQQIDTLQKTEFGHPFLRVSQQRELFQQNKGLIEQIKNIQNNMDTLFNNPPKGVNYKGQANNQNTQFGDTFNGEKIVGVKKIKG